MFVCILFCLFVKDSNFNGNGTIYCHNTVQAMGCDLAVGDGGGTCTIEWHYGGNNDSCPVAVDKSEGILFIG